MKEKGSAMARAAIEQIVRNQLESGTPPETRQTLERLIAQGRSEDEALRLIGSVVATEVYHVLKERRPYNREKFVEALRALPSRPREA